MAVGSIEHSSKTINKQVEVRPEVAGKLSLPLGAEFSELGLTLPKGLDYETWETVGTLLGQMDTGLPWAIGDWLIYGEHTLGEKYAQASAITGLSASRLQAYQWVASKFERSCRRRQLSFSHHELVARIDNIEERERLLDLAERGRLPLRALKARTRMARRVSTEYQRGSTPLGVGPDGPKSGTEKQDKGHHLVAHFRFSVHPGSRFVDALVNLVADSDGDILGAQWSSSGESWSEEVISPRPARTELNADAYEDCWSKAGIPTPSEALKKRRK